MQEHTVSESKSLHPNIEIKQGFVKQTTVMRETAVIRGECFDGKRLALYTDCYTGKVLRGDDNYAFGYIIAPEIISEYYNNSLSNKEISKRVNHVDNVCVSLKPIIDYKGNYDLRTRILENPAKIKQFKINVRIAKANYNKAYKAVFAKE